MAAAGAVGLLAGPANAATLTPSGPTTNLNTNDTVHLSYSGSSSAQVDFFQCTRTATSFGDCQGDTQQTMPLDFGAGEMDFTVSSTGCVPDLCSIWAVEDPTSFAGGTSPHVDITFASTPPVPEVPMAVMLPLGAGAVLGLGVLLNRRRHAVLGA